MNKAWKKLLLQWVLPVGVFAIIMAFVVASFKAKITSSATSEYEGNLVSATEEYATKIYVSIQKSKDVAYTVAELFADRTNNPAKMTTGLESIVAHSEAYLAVEYDGSEAAFTSDGSHIDINALTYAKDILSDTVYDYHFVPDDELTSRPAIVITVPIKGTPSTIMVYYPMDQNALKNVVPVEINNDSLAKIIVCNKDGAVLATTSSSDMYKVGSDAWESLIKENAEATIRRIKTKAQSGNSGSFSAKLGSADSLISYAPIPGTDQLLIIAFSQKNANRSIAKIISPSMKQLSLVVTMIVLFIAILLIINIMQIMGDNRSKEDLQEKADNDQLTGLKNKIATEREIKEYMAEYPDSIGMLFLVDIDNFKKINDTMGHAFGDEVLREIGRNIGVNFRVSDVIGRIGGDEFMVFLKNLKEDANTIKEAQKLTYFFKHFQVGDYVKYSVTASIGAAVFPAHGTDFESLYKSADAAVYKSKKRGKNQLSFFDDRDKTPEDVAYADAHLIDIERKDEATPIES